MNEPTFALGARICLFLASLALLGATPSPPHGSAVERYPTEEALRRQLSVIETSGDIPSSTRDKIKDRYKSALEELQAAAKARQDANGLRVLLVRAPDELQSSERTLRALEQDAATRAPPPLGEHLGLEELEQLELQRRNALDAAALEVGGLERAIEEAGTGSSATRREQDSLRAEIARLESELKAPKAGGEQDVLADAQRLLARARLDARRARLDVLDQQSSYQPALIRLTELRREIARIQKERAEAALKQVRMVLDERRTQEAETARRELERKRSELLDLPEPLGELAALNVELRAEVAETGLAVDRTLSEVTRQRNQLAELERETRIIERRAAIPGLRGDLGSALIAALRNLPKVSDLAEGRAQRHALMAKTTQARFKTEKNLADLAERIGLTAKEVGEALASESPERAARIDSAARQGFSERRSLLGRLAAQQDALLRSLHDAEETELDLLARATNMRNELRRLIFWVPLSPIGGRTFLELGTALHWIAAPANWRMVGSSLAGEARSAPATTGVVLALVAVLLAGRARLKRRLESLAPRAVSLHQYHISHTLGALAVTVLLALPWSLLAWGTGTLLSNSAGAGEFAYAVGTGLTGAAVILLLGGGFIWLLDRRGVAVNHFGWNAERSRGVQRSLHKLMSGYVPLVFLASAAWASNDDIIVQSLGRLSLMLGLFMIAGFWASGLRPERILASANSPGDRPAGTRLWVRMLYWAGVILPLVLAAAAALGFYFAAAYLYQSLMLTLLLGLAIIMLYGLVALWSLVQGARLQQTHGALSEAPAEHGADGAAVRTELPDIAAISAQTQQMLNLFLAIVFVVGVYLIWRGAFPALEVLGDIKLWTYSDTEAGQTVARNFTLGGLLLALLVAGVVYISARNVGGMLDAILLKRLALQADANYAIKTVARYGLTILGILVAASMLGVSWSSVQWLVAALGVGLGFGLQEIVANFVSGLIVLAERPIRIGDTITVGDVTGTVSRIRARATVLTDFDNRDVLIPNKAFITERVTNWTLSDQATRVLLRVGVARGSEPERVRQLLLDAVRAVPLAVSDPPPQVHFMAYGEGSLTFEIRVYAAEMSKRLALTHDANVAIGRALAAAGIEIPLPQRELHIPSGIPSPPV